MTNHVGTIDSKTKRVKEHIASQILLQKGSVIDSSMKTVKEGILALLFQIQKVSQKI